MLTRIQKPDLLPGGVPLQKWSDLFSQNQPRVRPHPGQNDGHGKIIKQPGQPAFAIYLYQNQQQPLLWATSISHHPRNPMRPLPCYCQQPWFPLFYSHEIRAPPKKPYQQTLVAHAFISRGVRCRAHHSACFNPKFESKAQARSRANHDALFGFDPDTEKISNP